MKATISVYFAAQALSGLITAYHPQNPNFLAALALEQADALINALNKHRQPQ